MHGSAPAVLNTTRIKKYSTFCIVQDELTGASTPVLPAQAAILALCRGVLDRREIIDGIAEIFQVQRQCRVVSRR